MHDCIVEIRIKFLSYSFDRFYSNLNPVSSSSACRSSPFLLQTDDPFSSSGTASKTSFKIINNRKNFFNDIFRTDIIHLGLFFFCSLAEVIKLCHLTSESISKFFDLLVFFVFFFSFRRTFSDFSSLILFRSGIFSVFCCIFGIFLASASAASSASAVVFGFFCFSFCFRLFYSFFHHIFFAHVLCHQLSTFLSFWFFIINRIQLTLQGLQRLHDMFIIHSFRTDNSNRSLHAFSKFICGCYHAAVFHRLHRSFISDINLNPRACLKKAFCKMCVTICGRFCPDEGAVAGYGNRIRAKYTAKWGVQIAGMIFQTGST